MSSTTPYRVVVHLSIIFVCALVCEGRLFPLGEHKREGDNVYESSNSLQPNLIEFPALDEMSSGERAENRQRARKVATILEKSLHMIANDILQMWAITRSDGGGGETSDTGEDADNETDTKAGEEGIGRTAPENDGAEKTEGAETDNTEDEETRPVISDGEGSSLETPEEGGSSPASSEGQERNKATTEGLESISMTTESARSIPATPEGAGSIPATPEGAGSIPATPEGAGSIPATPEGAGSIPATPEGAGSIPSTPEGAESLTGGNIVRTDILKENPAMNVEILKETLKGIETTSKEAA